VINPPRIDGIFRVITSPNSHVSLHIFIPEHLLEALCSSSVGTVLAQLMAKATHEQLALPMDVLICQYAGIETSGHRLPIAAITYLGEAAGKVHAHPAAGDLLFADPVHLLLQRDSFSLSGPVPLPLSLDESTKLIASLNQHFQSDGLKFLLTDSGRWCLRLDHLAEISTFHPAWAINKDINAFLPGGKEAAKWRRLMNEIQMMLFSHPVNQARELAGLPVCNSLWFWGEGALPIKQKATVAKVYASSALLKGLDQLGYVKLVDSKTLIFTDSHDQPMWWMLGEVKEVCEEAVCNILAMLKSGQICDLQLHYELNGAVLRSRVTRLDLLKFWRKASPIQSYFRDLDADHH
jgi:hypothetical protein